MKTKLVLVLLFVIEVALVKAQVNYFPQSLINESLRNANLHYEPKYVKHDDASLKKEGAFQCIKQMEIAKQTDWNKYIPKENTRALDTVYVGAALNDTLVITGVYNHEGPIFVFNDGVLIIHNASVINEGDIYVFGNGQLLCDSSNLTFPQQYFYQRGLISGSKCFGLF